MSAPCRRRDRATGTCCPGSAWARLPGERPRLHGGRPAPELPTERNPDGSRVRTSVDSRGKFVPVIVVHGWIGKATHSEAGDGAFSHKIDLSTNKHGTPSADRSLIGQIQRLGGTEVFTFDYRDYAARWVTDAHLGPALGSAIDCLHRRTGEKVIIVAHSMGGLLTRHALALGGAQRASLRLAGSRRFGSRLAAGSACRGNTA